MAGYSATPLLGKIGVKPGLRIYLDNVPEGLDLDWPPDVTVLRRLTRAPVDSRGPSARAGRDSLVGSTG